MAKTENKVYFPNLDGLRFIGSLSIILFHIDMLESDLTVPDLKAIHHYVPLGNLSVSMFFVLSGFLISFLLLKEKGNTSAIDLKGFYTRRILKIWPLYFIVIILGLFVLPYFTHTFYSDYSSHTGNNLWAVFAACFLFLPVIIFNPGDLPHTIRLTWTVRVEEFFYLFWPILLKKTKNFILTCILIIVGVILLRFCIFFLLKDYLKNIPICYDVFLGPSSVIMQYRISCMAIGGIGAYLVMNKENKITEFLYRKDIQFATYISTLILLITKVHIPFIYPEFYSALFVIIIMNLADNDKCIISLDYKWLNYLGKRSYGLYLYSTIVTMGCINVLKKYGHQLNNLQINLLLYTSVIVITIIVAIISYQFLEKPFLKLKRKYTVVG